jgi:hypothetical protein
MLLVWDLMFGWGERTVNDFNNRTIPLLNAAGKIFRVTAQQW